MILIDRPDPSKTGIHYVVVRGTMGEAKHILCDSGYQKYYNDIDLATGGPTGQKFQVLYLEDYKKKNGMPLLIYNYDKVSLGTSQSTPTRGKNLVIYGISETGESIELGIIDIQGRYLGYDPSQCIRIPKDKWTYEGEIPNARYYYNAPYEGNIGGTKELTLVEPPTGNYTLKVLGIDASERFWLTIVCEHPDENFDDIKVPGSITPGQVIEYSLHFSQTIGIASKIAVIGKLDLDPDILNLKSNGNYVTAYIELPKGHNTENIDIETILLEGQLSAISHPTEIGDHNGNGIPDLMVKFDRQALVSYLKSNSLTSGEVTLKVTGKVGDVSFKAIDKIKVK